MSKSLRDGDILSAIKVEKIAGFVERTLQALCTWLKGLAEISIRTLNIVYAAVHEHQNADYVEQVRPILGSPSIRYLLGYLDSPASCIE